MHKNPQPIVVDGLHLDGLFVRKPHVIESMPEEDRSRYLMWTALHMGTIACNLLRGERVLNSEANNEISFSRHERAQWIARSLVNAEVSDAQYFKPSDREYLESRIGKPLPRTMPVMVVALDNDRDLGIPVALYKYNCRVPMSWLTESSRLCLGRFFEAPLLAA